MKFGSDQKVNPPKHQKNRRLPLFGIFFAYTNREMVFCGKKCEKVGQFNKKISYKGKTENWWKMRVFFGNGKLCSRTVDDFSFRRGFVEKVTPPSFSPPPVTAWFWSEDDNTLALPAPRAWLWSEDDNTLALPASRA